MEKFEKIILLNNEFEARLLGEVLKDKNIPHIIRTYSDSAYDGVWQLQHGWGHIEAPNRNKDEIIAIYNDIIKE